MADHEVAEEGDPKRQLYEGDISYRVIFLNWFRVEDGKILAKKVKVRVET